MTADGTGPIASDVLRRAVRRAALLTAGAGIAFGAFSIAAWWLIGRAQSKLADGADPYEIYGQDDFFSAELAGLYLLPFAAILFLWFIVALRGWIRETQRRGNPLISDIQFVSGVVFAGVFLVGSGAAAASVIVVQTDYTDVSSDSLRVLNAFGNTLMTVMAVRIAAIFVITTASLGMTTGVLPRWFDILSYGFGVILLLTPVVAAALIVTFPIWTIVLSVMLLHHLASVPPDRIPGFAERYAARLAAEAEADPANDGSGHG